MLNRNTTTYALGSAGLTYSTTSTSGATLEEIPETASAVTGIWYDLFPSLVDSGLLSQVDGKFYLDGMMVSDLVSISVGLISAIVLVHRLIGDFALFIIKRRLKAIEEKALKEKN